MQDRHTQPIVFSVDETADVGRDTGTGVSDEYIAETSRFNGKINWVQIDVGGEDADHLISPKERLGVAWRGSDQLRERAWQGPHGGAWWRVRRSRWATDRDLGPAQPVGDRRP